MRNSVTERGRFVFFKKAVHASHTKQPSNLDESGETRRRTRHDDFKRKRPAQIDKESTTEHVVTRDELPRSHQTIARVVVRRVKVEHDVDAEKGVYKIPDPARHAHAQRCGRTRPKRRVKRQNNHVKHHKHHARSIPRHPRRVSRIDVPTCPVSQIIRPVSQGINRRPSSPFFLLSSRPRLDGDRHRVVAVIVARAHPPPRLGRGRSHGEKVTSSVTVTFSRAFFLCPCDDSHFETSAGPSARMRRRRAAHHDARCSRSPRPVSVRFDGEKIRASRRDARDASRARARDEVDRARDGVGDVARRRCAARDAVMRDARRRAREDARWIGCENASASFATRAEDGGRARARASRAGVHLTLEPSYLTRN